MRNLTVISKHNMEFLKGEEKTAAEMVEFLNQGAMYRSFEQVLKKVYQEQDLKIRLESGMADLTGDSRESIVRKVSNWIKGKNIPKNRDLRNSLGDRDPLPETERGGVCLWPADRAVLPGDG